MTTLRSVVAHLARLIRCAGIAYIVVQILIWHAFYTAVPWRLLAPVLAVAWAVTVTAYLRRRWPSPLLACLDSAVYVALALGAQESVPPAVRDNALSWLVIGMSGQLIVPAWYAPGMLSVLLTLSSPLAFWAGAVLLPVTNVRTLAGSGILLLVVGLAHGTGRRVFYVRASGADLDVDRASQAAQRQYAVLRRNIERREHERLLHDTVLNTLTALARAGGAGEAEMVTRCRQDVALIEAALGGADDLTADAVNAPADLMGKVRAVAVETRARGLTVHLDAEGGDMGAVPAPAAMAISNAVREALSNVAEHAGTGEAWVTVHGTAPEVPGRLRVVVRDKGRGFDIASADPTRLGLRRSITERVAECGGHASIWSAPGQGTEVSLSWPAPGSAGHTQADPGSLPW